VAGTVDAIENFGHMLWQCKPPGAQGQSRCGGNRG